MPQHTHRLTCDGSEVRKTYVSWGRGEPDREWAALTLLAEHAPGLAPLPLRRHGGDGAPAVVMSRLPGRPLAGPVSPAQVEAWGVALRTLHAVPVDAVRGAGLAERVNGPTSFAGAVASWTDDDPDVTGCRDGALVLDGLAAARTWLASPAARPRAVEDPVLGMADGNLDNVLWDGAVCRLVDFEDAGVSDPAYEVADAVEHVSVRLHARVDPDALMAAAGLTSDQVARATSYRPLMAAFWMVMLLPGNPGFARNPPGSAEDQARHLVGLLTAVA